MKQDRETMILELLTAEHRLEVSALAGRVGVSQVTMRKDLDDLERRGLVIREHGCALLRSSDDVQSRIAYHYEAKRKIAERAAELVDNGDTIMIESGSCCALLAEEIAHNKPGATIITNSAFIASYVRRVDGARVVLLGGDFQNDAQVMVGPILKVCAQQFYVERLFVGADGWSPALGFTGNNHLRVQAVRDMAEHAGQVVVVTESEKFSQRGVVPLNLPASVSAVVTDCGLTGEQARQLSEAGTQIYQAEEESAL